MKTNYQRGTWIRYSDPVLSERGWILIRIRLILEFVKKSIILPLYYYLLCFLLLINVHKFLLPRSDLVYQPTNQPTNQLFQKMATDINKFSNRSMEVKLPAPDRPGHR